MRRYVPYLLIGLGALIFAYPFLSSAYISFRQEQLLDQWEMTAAYEHTIAEDDARESGSSDIVDPDTSEGGEEQAAQEGGHSQEKESSPGFSSIGVLIIETIDLELPILDGTSDAQLRVGAGLLEETATVDEEGNTVLTAHRSHTHGLLFNRLDEVQVDDQIYVVTGSGRQEYVVRTTEVVDKEDATDFTAVSENERLTLITCDPLGVVDPPDRLVVVAEPAE